MAQFRDYNNIPQELKDVKRWVLWRIQDGTKIPINARTGYGAKSNDSDTWVSFDEALSSIDTYNANGLGFMLGGGYFGVDIDHAIDNKELIDEFTTVLDSYCEVSQSGSGIHIICRGTLPVGKRRKGNIEMYDSVRFFALTGQLYDGVIRNVLSDKTNEIIPLWSKYLDDSIKYDYVVEKTTKLTDAEIIKKAQESKNGILFNSLYCGQWEGMYPSQSEADGAFCSLLAFWTNKNSVQMDRIFRNSKLYREKWDRKLGDTTYGQKTINNAIMWCRDTFGGDDTKTYNVITGESHTSKKYDLSDTGNAERFVDRFGDIIRYNVDNKYWMLFTGKTWVKDNKQVVKTKADILIQEIKKELVNIQDKTEFAENFKNFKHLSSSSGKESMLKEAMHLADIPVYNSEFNKNKYLLNCNNGVVDLKTGKLMPHDKRYMQSKSTNIDCDLENEPKRWLQFLLEIFDNNKEMVDYMQTAIGYTLTGDTKEQCFFQCYGEGANGKSVFLDILYAMLGDYSLNSQIDTILARGGTVGATNEIARMDGARFVRTNEPNEGSRFNEGLVKQLVSGDVTTARYLYGMDFEFNPCFKLWIATNYKIQVRGTDYGIWRRMRLVPFLMKFEGDKADKHLTEKLMDELPQILGWAVKGAMIWCEKGLIIPKEIEIANNEYKSEMDVVSTFINENCRLSTVGKERAGDVFKAYKEWARESNEWSGMTQTKFGIELSKHFNKKVVAGTTYYVGFVLKSKDTSYIVGGD